MILQTRRTVDVAQSVAAARLDRCLRSAGLDAAAGAAIAEHEPVLVRAGVAGITKQVAVQSLEPTRYTDRVLIPVRWVATGTSGDLFPSLDANLELRADPAGGTEIVMIGSYLPPFGQTGAVIDRLVMRRVAQATMGTFLDRISRMIASPESVIEPRARRLGIPELGLEPNA